MRFFIDTRDGRTITADLADCSQPYPFVDRIDIYISVRPATQIDDGCENVPCILSTARSLEAEAVKDAEAIIWQLVRMVDEEDAEQGRAWLEKWGRE